MRLSHHHGYVGMYVVDARYRGLGVGKQVWNAALAHLGPGRNNGLSAVPSLFPLYRDKAGFGQVADWSVHLYRLDNMSHLLFRCKRHRMFFTNHHYQQQQHAHHHQHAHWKQQQEYNNCDEDNDNDDGHDGEDECRVPIGSLLEYYRYSLNYKDKLVCDEGDCTAPLGDDHFDQECNFFCLAQHHFRSKWRRSSRRAEHPQLPSPSPSPSPSPPLPMSDMIVSVPSGGNLAILDDDDDDDDSSLGFSSLFHDKQKDDPDQGLIEAKKKPTTKTTTVNPDDHHRHPPSQADVGVGIECGLQLRNFCTNLHCAQANKIRTMVINGSGGGHGGGHDNLANLVQAVVDYDNRMHSYDRSRIVRATLGEMHCITRVALCGNTVLGYGCIKPNLQSSWIVCPLYADTEYVAKLILFDLVIDHTFVSQFNPPSSLESMATIVLKTPSNNGRAERLLADLGFIRQDYCLARCYTRQVFPVPTDNIYALQSSVFCTE